MRLVTPRWIKICDCGTRFPTRHRTARRCLACTWRLCSCGCDAVLHVPATGPTCLALVYAPDHRRRLRRARGADLLAMLAHEQAARAELMTWWRIRCAAAHRAFRSA